MGNKGSRTRITHLEPDNGNRGEENGKKQQRSSSSIELTDRQNSPRNSPREQKRPDSCPAGRPWYHDITNRNNKKSTTSRSVIPPRKVWLPGENAHIDENEEINEEEKQSQRKRSGKGTESPRNSRDNIVNPSLNEDGYGHSQPDQNIEHCSSIRNLMNTENHASNNERRNKSGVTDDNYTREEDGHQQTENFDSPRSPSETIDSTKDSIQNSTQNSGKKKKKNKKKSKGLKDRFKGKNIETQTDDIQTDEVKTKDSGYSQPIMTTVNETLLSLENDINNKSMIRIGGTSDVYKEDNDETAFGDFFKICTRIGNMVQEMKTKIANLKRENDNNLNRLSKTAGTMLSYNNANVANLNDSDRPMKISERYGNLYDNEWSNAFEELIKHYDEKTTIYHLFSLLKVIYMCCQQKAELQEGHMFTMANNSKVQINEMWKNIPEERDKFMETRKRMAPVVIQFLQKTLKDDDIYRSEILKCVPALRDDILKILHYTKYFDKCVEVCWYMAIQVPPLYLDTTPLEGTALNKDTHKEYTCSGTIVDFIVWPTLYLTEEGKSILFKGTAQPRKIESSEGNGK